jgi:hypothetical protein
MAVVFDAQSSNGVGAATTGPLNFNHTIGAGVTKGVALVFIAYRLGATETFTVTIGGTTATQITGTATNEANIIGSVCFGLATGNLTGVVAVAISWTNSLAIGAGIITFDNVDQAVPYSNGTSAHYVNGTASISLPITGTSGGATVDGLGSTGSGDTIAGPTGSATGVFGITCSDGMRFEGSYELDGSHTHTWTTSGGSTAQSGVNVNADAGTIITGLGRKHQGFIYARPYL